MFFYSDQNNCSYSTGNNLKTRLTRQLPLVEQQLLTLPEHMSSSPVFNGVRVTQSLVLCICFVDRCLSFCTFSFGHCVVCSSLIYWFWLPLWYLQIDYSVYIITINSISYIIFYRQVMCPWLIQNLLQSWNLPDLQTSLNFNQQLKKSVQALEML